MSLLLDGKVRNAVFSLFSVLIGAYFFMRQAWALYDAEVWLWFAVLVFGLFAGMFGKQFLPNRPRLALFIMEFRTLATLAIVSALVAVSLCVATELVPSASASGDVKTVLLAVDKAVVAIVAALTVAVAGTQGASATSKFVQRAFESMYRSNSADVPEGVDIFPEKSEIIKAVHSDMHSDFKGWDFDARWQRAMIISNNLKKDIYRDFC